MMQLQLTNTRSAGLGPLPQWRSEVFQTSDRRRINPLFPGFLKWTLQSLNLYMSTDLKRGVFQSKKKTKKKKQKQTNKEKTTTKKKRMANGVHPDETDLDIHCVRRYLFWSAGLKGFSKLKGFC